MQNELIVGTIISITVGLIGVLLGILIGKYKLAHIIAGFDPNKYDKDKLCEIVSSNIILFGILMIVYSMINYLAYDWIKDTEISTILNVGTIIFILVNISYRSDKYARKE